MNPADLASDTVTRSVCREFYSKFPRGKSRNPEELVDFIVNHPSSRKKIEEWLESQECLDPDDGNKIGKAELKKNNAKSRKERESGNAYFTTTKLIQSLNHYNEAIKYASESTPEKPQIPTATDDGLCLSMALANRSAVLAELGKEYFDKALQDVDFAIKYGYPVKLRPKLLLRKASIYVEQGKRNEAQECLDLIGNCEDEKWNKKKEDIQNTITSLSSDDGNSDKDNLRVTGEKSGCADLNRFKENQKYANASEAITIKTSKVLGRHVVALKNLEKDEVLYCEKPFASVLLPDYYDTHCHYCHKSLRDQRRIEYFFPCLKCTQVKFCDYVCFKEADSSFHKHECGWLDFINSVGIAHLAIRVVLVAGVNDILKCLQDHSSLTSLDNLKIFEKDCNNYPRVYSLLPHIDDMYEDDLFQYSLVAGLLTRFLSSKTQFLNGVPAPSQRKVGGVMLRHICQLICNAHGITEISSVDNSFHNGSESGEADQILIDDTEQQRIATAVYPAASMMNHSCGPNIKFYFENGRTLIVKAYKEGIVKGEEVLNCYGPTYQRMPREERQECLKQQYFFDCRCLYCKIESVDRMSSLEKFTGLKCGKCEAICPWEGKSPPKECQNCGEMRNTKEDLEVLKKILELHNKGDDLTKTILERVKIWKTCFDLAAKLFYKDNWRYGEICDRLALSLVLSDRKEEAKWYLRESLKCVAAMFGQDSVEFQHEAEKYSDLYDETFQV